MAKFFSDSSSPEVALTISARTFFKVLLLVLVTILLLGVVRKAAYAMIVVFVACFLAMALNAPVSWVARHLPGQLRGSRTLATALSFLMVLAVLATLAIGFVLPVVRQTQALINNAPALVQSLHNNNSDAGRFVAQYHLQSQIDAVTHELSNRLQNSSGTAVTAIQNIATSVVASLTILVLTFMMLVEGPYWLKLIRQLLPVERQAQADRLTNDMYKVIKGYVNGQVLLALIASLLVLPGLLVFHVDYPFALMGLVFICGLIPMVGHTIGALIVTAVALFHSPLAAVGILVYYIAYQQIETYLIQPRLQATVTHLSPLLVLMSLTVGISFGGLVGGLVAIPIAACLRVWLIDFLATRRSVDRTTG